MQGETKVVLCTGLPQYSPQAVVGRSCLTSPQADLRPTPLPTHNATRHIMLHKHTADNTFSFFMFAHSGQDISPVSLRSGGDGRCYDSGVRYTSYSHMWEAL